MGGGGHHLAAVPFSRLDDEPPGLAQRLAHLRHPAAHPRVGLDLGAEELVHDLVRATIRLARLEDSFVGIGEEIAGIGVDEKELLLDPERDPEAIAGVGGVHGPPAASGRAVL